MASLSMRKEHDPISNIGPFRWLINTFVTVCRLIRKNRKPDTVVRASGGVLNENDEI